MQRLRLTKSLRQWLTISFGLIIGALVATPVLKADTIFKLAEKSVVKPGFVAKAMEKYTIDITKEPRIINGNKYEMITMNKQLPGPTLVMQEGQQVTITVNNKLDSPLAVHWHGILLPAEMDGAPGFNKNKPLAPGESYTYQFTPRQNGTFWYHSHEGLHEHEGQYGAIVILPKTPVKPAYSETVHSQQILMISDLIQGDLGARFAKLLKAPPADNMFEYDYDFLMGGHGINDHLTILYLEKMTQKLHFINASANSIFDLRIEGLPMTIVAADGLDTKPLVVEEIRIEPGQTFDVLVTPTGGKVYPIVAESIQGSGFALASLAPKFDMAFDKPKLLAKSRLNETDPKKAAPLFQFDQLESTPHAIAAQGKKHSGKVKVVDIRLTGDMATYEWGINGVYHPTEPLRLAYNERVRLRYINETDVPHPMHLHGMFVERVRANKAPLLAHTVEVPPGGIIEVEFTANEVGEWPLHCHMLYHMARGMMLKVIIDPKI